MATFAPINYALDVASPMQSFGQGFGIGAGIQEQQAKMQQQQAAAQQQQVAAARQQALSTRLQDLQERAKAGTASLRDYTSVMTEFPEFSDKLKPAAEFASKEELRDEVGFRGQVVNAIQVGDKETATKLLQDRIDTYRNSGREDKAKELEVAQKLFDQGDMGQDILFTAGSTWLAQAGDEGRATLEKILAARKAPTEERKLGFEAGEAGSKATSAAVAAKFAESKAVADLKLTGAQIAKLAEDTEIAKMNARTASAAVAATNAKTELERQRLGLEVEKMQDARDEKVRERVSGAREAFSAIDASQTVLDRLLSMSIDKDGKLKPAFKSVFGPIDKWTPTLDSETADVKAIISQVKASGFIGAVRQFGTAAGLSQKEGEKIEQLVINLDENQTPENAMVSLKELQRSMKKFREGLSTKYGVNAPAEDRPFAPRNATTITVDW